MDSTAVVPAPALSFQEGHSLKRPPLFNGSNYLYWKTRMRIFVQSFDIECWKVIVNGRIIPSKIVDGKLIPKHQSEYDVTDWKSIQLNAKAMNILHCGLDANESMRVIFCESGEEIWDKLKLTYEGTDKAKEIKIYELTRDYEMFVIKPEEPIREMDARFTYIVNSLKALGQTIDEERLVEKILMSLPRKWMSIVTLLLEKKLTHDELISHLLAHEEKMSKMKERNKRG